MATLPDSSDEPAIPEFEEVKTDVAEGREPSRSVRELLRWFGARRRRSGVVERIEAALAAAGLRTDPHFTTVWIDAPVTFRKRDAVAPAPEAPTAASPEGDAEETEAVRPTAFPDTRHLVRMLEAANRGIVSVNPQDPIDRAITLMLAHDYSQLAVMQSPHNLKGAISWKSIGSRLSQRTELLSVRDAVEPATEVPDTAHLFDVTRIVFEKDYAFVRSSVDRTITGIVTATDLSEQFHRLSEPFLLLDRIENQIRRIIEKSFDAETLRAACDDGDPERREQVSSASQLTFGEYLRLFEREENWDKLPFVACRKTFCKQVDDVRKLRNEIMHFNLDEPDSGEFEPLYRLSRLLEQLEKLGG